MASLRHSFIRLPERQRLPRCYTPPRPGGASCMRVRHGGIMLTQQVGTGSEDSCEEDCSVLVSRARQVPASTPQSTQSNSNFHHSISTLCSAGSIALCLQAKMITILFLESC